MRVVGINRYPVKSLQGERLREAAVDELGLVGDRRWGIVDVATGKVLSAKRTGALLGGSAVTTPDGPLVVLPDGREIEPVDPGRDQQLSDWLGTEVRLVEASAEAGVYDVSLQLDPDVDVFELPMTAGRFLDLSPVHVVTTASLRAAADAYPDGNWTTDRFRPSIVVDVAPDEGEGFVENDWIGKRVRIGEVEIDVILPTVRCVMTTRVQPTRDVERDTAIFTTLRDVNQQNLGVYANVTAPGTLHLDDEVYATG